MGDRQAAAARPAPRVPVVLPVYNGARGGRPRSGSLTPVLMLILTIGTLGAVASHYVRALYDQAPYPFSTFLFLPSDRFQDAAHDFNYAHNYATNDGEVIVYAPFAHLVMRNADVMLRDWRAALVVSLVAFFATLVFCLHRYFARDLESWALRTQALVVLSGLSYAVLFAVDRGNMDLLVFVALFWFVFFYERGVLLPAVFCLALAIALKLYPATLLVLLIADRRVRAAALTAGLALLFTAVGVVGVALDARSSVFAVLADWKQTLVGWHLEYSTTDLDPVQHGHSVWGAIHYVVWAATGTDPPGWAALAYLVAVVLAFAALSVWVVRVCRREPAPARWRPLAVLVLLTLLLPYLSHDYRLMLVYLPLMLLVAESGRTLYTLVAAALFGALLIPTDYVYLENDVSSAALIAPAVMIALIAWAMVGDRWSATAVVSSDAGATDAGAGDAGAHGE